jgi:PAS domain S-box-containing protein
MNIDGNREKRRIETLRELNILDTEAERDFDDIIRLAALICETPIALISLIDEERQWFKAILGTCLRETKREEAFCDHTIRNSEILVVPDATQDSRFSHFRMVTGPESIRFYAGFPILFNGEAIGALCVKDRTPRTLSEDQLSSLRSLAHQITRLLELKQQNIKLLESNAEAALQQKCLSENNQELNKRNQDMLSSEEEIRTNLEQISTLQAHLELREKQYRDLVESASDLIYELDEEGRFIFVNEVMEERSQYSRSQLLAMPYWKLVHPDDRVRVIAFYISQAKQHRQTSYLEFRMVAATGEEIWIGQNVRMMFNAQNRAYRAISVSRDINDVKMIERKLEDSLRLYRLLSTNSKDIISLFDIDENVSRKFISPSVKSILGYEPEELIGTSAFNLVLPEDMDRVTRMTQELTLSGQPASIEYRALKKDGQVIWLESNSSPIFDESGKMTGFQTSARDITRRKEFEASLQEAKKKAEEATLAKSQFLSMMSHEIRTPMNAIIGLTTLMLQNEPRPDQLESLKLLKFSGENLLTIVNDILDFSKIEANKIVLESVAVDFCSLLSNTKRILDQRVGEKGITLNFQFDPEIPQTLLCDPVRIAQVITNLAGNAIKFTEKGSVDLVVKLLSSKNGKNEILFQIKDTGIGIAPEKLETIFDRFSQADTDTTRRFGGTGLGLSITKSLLELMGSRIDLQSTIGKGSTFSFVLSLMQTNDLKNNKEETSSSNRSGGAGIRVLLVEDNKVNQIVARGFLKQWGISVDVANDGLEALRLVERKSYQVVLMDLQMPVMDGYEASKRIREMNDEYFKTIPIIALTASAMLGMKDKVVHSGMTDFVSKPFSPDELYSKILKHASHSLSAVAV